jgi:hypothetical protein
VFELDSKVFEEPFFLGGLEAPTESARQQLHSLIGQLSE